MRFIHLWYPLFFHILGVHNIPDIQYFQEILYRKICLSCNVPSTFLLEISFSDTGRTNGRRAKE